MAVNNEIRFLNPPTVEVKKKKYCRFKKAHIKYVVIRMQNSLRDSLTSKVKFFLAV